MANFLRKDIEQYGLIKVTEKGEQFLKTGGKFEISLNHDYSQASNNHIATSTSAKGAALDDTLMKMLKDLRLQEAKRHGVKPWVIFMDPSLQDMATYYPTSVADMSNISGVGEGKAKKYGQPFVEMIQDYVEEHDIMRPEDFVVKQVANKSKAKVSIILGVDRKMPLEDIADSAKLNMEQLLDEMDMIVLSLSLIHI